MAAFLHPDAPEQPAVDQASLLDVIATAQAWGVDLIRHLDSPTRTRVFKSCRALQQFVLQSAPQATVTLLAYDGLSEAVWQRRLARAEQALITRGPGQRRGTKVLLRIPTPHPTALQSILSMSEAASQCYAALEVQQYDYPTAAGPNAAPNPPQPWPAVVAPHIHTLILNHMCGPLPSPALLPQLRELQVHVWADHRWPVDTGRAESRRRVEGYCASIAPYITQLTSLTVLDAGGAAGTNPWPALFGSTVSTSLKHISSDFSQVDQILQQLLQRAPRLERVGLSVGSVKDTFSDKTWSVTELVCHFVYRADELVSLPSTQTELTVRAAGTDELDIFFDVVGRQGLDAAVAHRLAHTWRFTAPMTAHLQLPTDFPPADLQAGTEAALMQLSVLPAGSKVQLFCQEDEWQSVLAPAVAAITATAAHFAHLTVVAPPVAGPEGLQALCAHQPPLAHVSAYYVGGDETVAQADKPCPWQALHVIRGFYLFNLARVLELPDPMLGPCEIHCYIISVQELAKLTDEQFTQLEQRLQHITFVVRGTTTIEVQADTELAYDDRHTILPKALRALRACRWRRDGSDSGVQIKISYFQITPALMGELSALPVFDFPVTLEFSECSWSLECNYQQLASVIPTCYSTWELHISRRLAGKHISAICRGAQARGSACERLSLVVHVEGDARPGFTPAQRSLVEACLDAEGMSEWVECVSWVFNPDY